ARRRLRRGTTHPRSEGLGHNVRGFDASPALVEAARSADPALDVTQADAAGLPVEDDASDLVVSFMVLMNVDDLSGVAHEAARVLAPGGRLCIAITHPINTAGAFETAEPDSAFVIRESYFAPRRTDLRVER